MIEVWLITYLGRLEHSFWGNRKSYESPTDLFEHLERLVNKEGTLVVTFNVGITVVIPDFCIEDCIATLGHKRGS